MIQIEHLTYTYPQSSRPALRDIDLQVDAGTFVAVVGASGAGKSTLCAALAGFVPHHFRGDLRGRVIVDGLDTVATPLPELVPHVGLVFQNPFNQMSGAKTTVAEEIAFGLENLGVPRAEMVSRVDAALVLVGLRELSERSPFDLSGGEMQRVALACVIVMEPRVLVLDEPTAQLDPVGARQVFRAVRTIVFERRCTLVMVEHKFEWIAEFADRVVALKDGAVALDGTPREVLNAAGVDASGIGMPRYALAAREARASRWWADDDPLPATFEQAVDGFRPRSRA